MGKKSLEELSPGAIRKRRCDAKKEAKGLVEANLGWTTPERKVLLKKLLVMPDEFWKRLKILLGGN